MLRWLGALVGVLVSGAAALADDGVVRVGVLAYQGSERAARDWDATLDHLNRVIPDHRFIMVPLDLPGMVLAVADHRVDFVITNPGNYVTLEARFAVTRIATLESETVGSAMGAVGSTVFRRADREDLLVLKDLRGKSVAVVSTDAFGGFQIAWRELEEAGVRPFRDLRALTAVGFPMEGVVEAVRDGRADAGIVRACLLEELATAGRIRPDEFAVLGERASGGLPCRVSSRLYPDWPFARMPHTPRELARRVSAALLTMPPADGRGWTASLDYTAVHDLFRHLHIGPYPKTPPSVMELVEEYWQWLVVAVVTLLWWIVHAGRVEILVHRRTVELQREIAERERAEATALRLREERDQLSRLGIVGEMASNIAHELNQPLTAITNFGHGMIRILDSRSPDPGLLRSGAKSVVEQAELAAAIIRRTRAFVRRKDALHETIDVNGVVGEALSLFAAPSDRRSVPLRAELAEGLPPVAGDRVELQQVLLNLLQNAVDATQDGGDGTGIVVRTALAGALVEVSVTDGGTGAAPETLAKLFDPFYTTKPDGLGLGLSICRTIVERHGGGIRAEPNPERGMTVLFTLPAVEDAS